MDVLDEIADTLRDDAVGRAFQRLVRGALPPERHRIWWRWWDHAYQQPAFWVQWMPAHIGELEPPVVHSRHDPDTWAERRSDEALFGGAPDGVTLGSGAVAYVLAGPLEGAHRGTLGDLWAEHASEDWQEGVLWIPEVDVGLVWEHTGATLWFRWP